MDKLWKLKEYPFLILLKSCKILCKKLSPVILDKAFPNFLVKCIRRGNKEGNHNATEN